MYRVKVALISVAVVALASAVVFSMVSSTLNQTMVQQVELDVTHAQQQLLVAARLNGVDLASQVAGLAREDEFVQVFAKPDAERTQAAFVAIEGRKARMETKATDDSDHHSVGIMGVVDAQGHLVARDLNPNWRRGDDLKKDFPSLEITLTKGQANKDIWNLDGAMYRVGSAPIKGPGGAILGALFIGYAQSVQDAREARKLLGGEVAYFVDGKIHASSFDHKDESSSESTVEKQIAEQLFTGQKLAEKVETEHVATPVFRLKLGHDEWAAAAAPIPGNATSSRSGFVVLSSVTAAAAPLASLGFLVLALGLIGALASLAAEVFTARRFLNPLDKIETGVAEVINGNREYVFESPSEDFEGLANGLNVMLARLLDRPEPGEEDGESEGGGSISNLEQ